MPILCLIFTIDVNYLPINQSTSNTTVRFILIMILTTSLQQVYGQLSEVKGTPNATELASIARVKQYYKDIKFTNSVTRHYAGQGSKAVLVKTTRTEFSFGT